MKSLILLLPLFFLFSCSHPITATSNPVGSAKGVACSRNLFFIIPLSLDASIYQAAKNGDIETISTVDSDYFYSGIYNSFCTIVRGHKQAKVVQAPAAPAPSTDVVDESPIE